MNEEKKKPKKTAWLHLRMEPRERQYLIDLAGLRGLNVSDCVRLLIDGKALPRARQIREVRLDAESLEKLTQINNTLQEIAWAVQDNPSAIEALSRVAKAVEAIGEGAKQRAEQPEQLAEIAA